jgi:heptosyltransferase-3
VKRQPAKDAAFDRIIVIVTRQIGDVLLTTPLIHEARRRWPQARIDVLGFAGTLGMLRGSPDIAELIEVAPGSGWRQSWPLMRRLWRRYDLALIAQHTDRAHLYGWMAARLRSGQVPENRRSWWKRSLLCHAVELGTAHSHVVLEKLRLLSPWVDPLPSPAVQAPPGRELPADLLAQLEPGYTVMQVPSLVRFKQWPLRHYAQLLKDFAARGLQVVLSGGPSASDRAAVREVIALSGVDGALDVAGQLDLNQMSALMANAALYIGPDTSITHLAAASGVPVLALFGPINPRLWGPWPVAWPPEQPYERSGPRQQRGNITLLQGTQSCVPCNKAGCDRHPDSRSECLETMTPQRVLEEALAILSPGEGNLRRS